MVAAAAAVALAFVFFRGAAVEAAYPVEKAKQSFSRKVWTRISGLWHGAEARAENVRLRREVAQLAMSLADAERVYIPTLRLGKNAQISVDVYSLSDGTLQKIIPLFDVSLAEIQTPENETIFLPIEWSPEGKIWVGGVSSGIQMVVD